MALYLAAMPRQGILLNSPSSSPSVRHTSLPTTTHQFSHLSSVQTPGSTSSSSSQSQHEGDNYFLAFVGPKDSSSLSTRSQLSGQNSSAPNTVSRPSSSRGRTGSAPQTRRIRFAPLPEPRRDEDELPDVFLDDSVEHLNTFPDAIIEASRSNPNSRPSSLIFHNSPDTQALAESTSSIPGPAPLMASSSGSERDDSDYLMTPVSPHTALSSATELPGSRPESPAIRRFAELPKEERKSRGWATKKLFKPFFGKREITTEDVLTLGVNQLWRRESNDGWSSGSSTPSGFRSRNQSRERPGSICSEKLAPDFGAPLTRCESGDSQRKKKSLLSSLTGGSKPEGAGLWRTQSLNGDMRRTQSHESTKSIQSAAELRRPRSSDGTTVTNGGRRQMRMLNGRVYGARRNKNQNVDHFASARSDVPDFVEWGYGGMGSVKAATSSGANSMWSRVQGTSAYSHDARARPGADEEDDGSGMAWLKKRREQREREKAECEAKEKEQAAGATIDGEKAARSEASKPETQAPAEESVKEDSQTPAAPEVPDPEKSAPVSVKDRPQSQPQEEHVTTTVTIPAPASAHHHAPAHTHARPSTERSPSVKSHALRAPERRSSADTARATSPKTGTPILPGSSEEVVGEMEVSHVKVSVELAATVSAEAHNRERRESESSMSSASATDDEDADYEESPKDSGDDDDVDEEEEQERIRRTALGAGVEKVSRHKDKAHSVDKIEA